MSAAEFLRQLEEVGAIQLDEPPVNLEAMRMAAQRVADDQPPEVVQQLVDRGLSSASLIEFAIDRVSRGTPGPLADRIRAREGFAFAVVQTEEINARAFCAPDGEWVLLFNTGMISALYGVARTFAARFATDGVEAVGCEACDDPAEHEMSIGRTARRFLEYGLRSVWQGTCGSEDWPALPWQLAAANEVTLAAETFVVGHEIAHHMLGHTVEDAQPLAALPGAVELSTNIDHELAADALGAVMLLSSALAELVPEDGTSSVAVSVDDVQMEMVGIESFLTTSDLLIRCCGRDPKQQQDTHPSTDFRREVVRRALGETIGGGAEAYDRATADWRSLAMGCWQTLLSPSAHDLLAWKTDAASAAAAAARSIDEVVAQRASQESLQAAHSRRWEQSQLLFDRAVLDVAREDVGVRSRVAAALLGRVCTSPPELVVRIDPTAALLGLGGLVFADVVDDQA